jgi:hypothetical protein
MWADMNMAITQEQSNADGFTCESKFSSLFLVVIRGGKLMLIGGE